MVRPVDEGSRHKVKWLKGTKEKYPWWGGKFIAFRGPECLDKTKKGVGRRAGAFCLRWENQGRGGVEAT